jgi:DNA-binding transcriptional regulator PaaX
MMTEIKDSNLSVVEGIPVEITQTVIITPAMMVKYLSDYCGSDGMELFINAMGRMHEKHTLTTCWAADGLTEAGREFIDDMHYFLHRHDSDANDLLESATGCSMEGLDKLSVRGES